MHYFTFSEKTQWASFFECVAIQSFSQKKVNLLNGTPPAEKKIKRRKKVAPEKQ